jgi:hypothetical protein
VRSYLAKTYHKKRVGRVAQDVDPEFKNPSTVGGKGGRRVEKQSRDFLQE